LHWPLSPLVIILVHGGGIVSICKYCGETFIRGNYPTIRTQRIRYCASCLEWEHWNLDEGQDPVGYNIDKDLANKHNNKENS